ncbi:Glyceraldehyde-3-phosphate dehydrogenase [Acipenser ruthenus]|uniref:Glyceraldehyde-3-phosphate dehydrogenase n=1 Tax=Acipenser ruthenus TaxID=7906 RepID=A0A444V0E3_ACIRT|nr:Glyceraldehyde-3-phosphate dehydrogenase [Acipenser ruthenus]
MYSADSITTPLYQKIRTVNTLFNILEVYMLKNDSTHSPFKGELQAEEGELVINGKPEAVFQELVRKKHTSRGAEFTNKNNR